MIKNNDWSFVNTGVKFLIKNFEMYESLQNSLLMNLCNFNFVEISVNKEKIKLKNIYYLEELLDFLKYELRKEKKLDISKKYFVLQTTNMFYDFENKKKYKIKNQEEKAEIKNLIIKTKGKFLYIYDIKQKYYDIYEKNEKNEYELIHNNIEKIYNLKNGVLFFIDNNEIYFLFDKEKINISIGKYTKYIETIQSKNKSFILLKMNSAYSIIVEINTKNKKVSILNYDKNINILSNNFWLLSNKKENFFLKEQDNDYLLLKIKENFENEIKEIKNMEFIPTKQKIKDFNFYETTQENNKSYLLMFNNKNEMKIFPFISNIIYGEKNEYLILFSEDGIFKINSFDEINFTPCDLLLNVNSISVCKKYNKENVILLVQKTYKNNTHFTILNPKTLEIIKNTNKNKMLKINLDEYNDIKDFLNVDEQEAEKQYLVNNLTNKKRWC